MTRVDRRVPYQPPGRDRDQDLDHERRSPHDVVPWLRHGERGEPDQDSGSERGQEGPRERTRLRDVTARPRIERNQDEPYTDIRDREAGLRSVEDLRNRRGEHGHAEHCQQQQQTVGQIVRVEPVRVEREAHPRPPDGDEDPEELEEAARSRGRAERVRELADRCDEDQVEEELEPGRATVFFGGAAERAQARRLEQPREACQRPLKSGLRFSVNAVRPSFASSDAKER